MSFVTEKVGQDETHEVCKVAELREVKRRPSPSLEANHATKLATPNPEGVCRGPFEHELLQPPCLTPRRHLAAGAGPEEP